MTRKEFMSRLEQLLQDLPENDRLDAIAYYEDYFDEAGPQREAALIQELGSPEKVAQALGAETGNRGTGQGEYTERGYFSDRDMTEKHTPIRKEVKKEKRQFPLVLIVILLIFAAPVWIGAVSGLFGILFGIIGAVLGCIAALIVLIAAGIFGGAASFVAGLIKLPLNPALGLLGIGIGTLMIAIGLVLLVFFVWLTAKALPAVFRFAVNLCQKVLYKIRGGNRNE